MDYSNSKNDHQLPMLCFSQYVHVRMYEIHTQKKQFHLKKMTDELGVKRHM